MRKMTILLIAFIFEVFLLSAQTSTPPLGTGTSGDPYLIASLNNLYWLSQTSAAWSSCCLQTADIDAAATSTWNSNKGFSPIGNNTTKFTGSYNGKGHLISGLYINQSSSSNVALFGYCSGATIDSLGLVGTTITGNQYVGGIVGRNYSSKVSNCYCTGSVTGLGNDVGGLVGHNFHYSSVKNCYSTGQDISGIDQVGGVVGYNYDNSTITDCYSTNNVLGGAGYIGGVVGYNYTNSTVTNCYSTGSVSGSTLANSYVGGVVGVNSTSCTVTNCYCSGTVSGTGYIGGVLGWNSTNTSTLTNCYWDTQTTSKTNGYGYNSGTFTATGLTTVEMQSADLVSLLNANRGNNLSWISVSGGYPTFSNSNIIEGTGTCLVTVPAGTKVCYITGDMNNWGFTQMTKVDATHFTITLPSLASFGYKYCSGPAWAYQELDGNGNDISNRTYAASDIVAKWLHVYDPENPPYSMTYSVTVPSGTNACYIVGDIDMSNWASFIPMTQVDVTHYTITLISSPDFNFKYCSGAGWPYVEVNADGSEAANRVYSTSDVVVKWKGALTSIPTVDADRLTLYPNPATDDFTIKNLEGSATAILSDLCGRQFLSKEVIPGQTVSVKTLPNGVYLATIVSNGTRKTEKLIIQRE